MIVRTLCALPSPAIRRQASVGKSSPGRPSMQPRDKWVHFVMSQDELERMQQKMDDLGIRNKSAYLRKMALDGYCVNLELDDVKKMVSLLRYCSNNLNQYAKRANENGSIYTEDIKDLQKRQNQIWEIAKEILARLATIQ